MLARIVFYILARLVQFVAFLMYLSAVHQSIPLTEVYAVGNAVQIDASGVFRNPCCYSCEQGNAGTSTLRCREEGR